MRRERCASFANAIAAAVVAACAVTASPTTAGAFPLHARWFTGVYGRPVGCQLCHEGQTTRRNAYGEAWQKVGEATATFRAIEALDSDGDGATNAVEIAKNSNPGDPKSTPDKPGELGLSNAKVFIPAEELELVLGETSRIEVSELELSAEAIARAEVELGRKLEPAERWLTLYFAVEKGKRKEVALFSYADTARGRFVVLIGVGGSAAIRRAVVLASGSVSGGVYARYLGCFAGKNAAALPAPSDAGCGAPNVEEDVAEALRRATRESLVLLSAGLKKRAAQ